MAACSVALAVSCSVHAGPQSYRALRYTGVIGQTDWYTCGPAAAATLLHHYFGIPATEAELLALAVEAQTEMGNDPRAGISALALLRALERKGLPVRGYRVLLDDLSAYLHQGGLPVILHVTVPEPHYVVAVGAVGDAVLLADPSFGLRWLSLGELGVEKGFSGVTLVPLPPPDMAETAQQAQRATLAEALDRWILLQRWGGRRS